VASDPVIVVGTGRCGSTAVSQVARTNPRWLSLSEVFSSLAPRAFPDGPIGGSELAELLATPRYDSRVLLAHGVEDAELLYPLDDPRARFDRETGVPPLLVSTLPHLTGIGDELLDEICDEVRPWQPGPVASHYRRLFDWLRARFGAERWIERSGGSLVYVDRLIEAFPDARFVHIWRDGLECTLSMSRHTGFRLLMLREQMLRRFGADPFEDESRPQALLESEYASLLPERFDPEAFARFEVPLSKYAGVWSRQLLFGLPLLQALPAERVMHVGYARLVAEPAAAIRDLQRLDIREIERRR
jgi:putative sulfotransferase